MDNNYIIQLITKLDGSKTPDDLKKIEQQLNAKGINLKTSLDTATSKQELQNLAKQLQSVLKANKMEIDTSKILSAFNQVSREAEKLTSKANKIQLLMGANGDTTAQIEVLRNNFTRLGLSADEVKTKMSGVDTEVKTLQSLMNSGAENSAIVAQFEKLQTVLTQTQNNLKKTRSDYSLLATEQQRLSLANTIEAWNQKNTRATKEVRAENERYIVSLRDLNTEMTKLQFGQIQTGFKQAENSMRTLNKLGASLKDQMKQAADSFTQWISVSSAIMGVVYSTKQAVSELKDVNTILTEISKTSELTKQQLKDLGNSSFDTASKYGNKASNYLLGIQEMYRAGYENAEQLAELSTLAQSAGDLEAELANDYIIASDAAYGYAGNVEKLNALLDSQNQVTNKNAVSMEELARATKVAANQLSNANISENEMTALLGTGIATSREAGETVGRAVKGIIMNLQQVAGETGFDGEIIDEESLKKVEARCHSVGVELEYMKDGIVRLRNPMEILKELADVYNSLPSDSADKAGIISDIGGKYRGNVLSSILSNWDKYEKMLQDYENATGSAMNEAMKSANNWEGSLIRLSNTWTDTIGNIANSDTIITIINGLNNLLSVVNNVTNSLGSLGTIGLGAGIFAGFKNVGRLKMQRLIVLNCRQQYVFFRILKFSYCEV